MGKILSKDGTSIAFSKTGNGPALVLIDGAFCYREYGISPGIVPLLSDKFTVYTYDRRGRGESEDNSLYSVENEIEDLISIIELTKEDPYLFGMSSGAALLLQLLSTGIRVKGIVMYEPPYFTDSSKGSRPPSNSEIVLKNLILTGKRDEAVQYFMTKIMAMPGIFVLLFKFFGKSKWKKNLDVAHTLAYDVAIMGDFLIPMQNLQQIKIPAYIICGEKSPHSIKEAAKTIAENIPNGRLKLLKDQSHAVNVKVLASVLQDIFIRETKFLQTIVK